MLRRTSVERFDVWKVRLLVPSCFLSLADSLHYDNLQLLAPILLLFLDVLWAALQALASRKGRMFCRLLPRLCCITADVMFTPAGLYHIV